MLFFLLSAAMAGEVCPETETIIGSGTTDDPWLICTADQLRGIQDHPDDSFQLGDDIDLSEQIWNGILSCALFPAVGGFTGHLDGAGHTISGMTSDDNGSGLFTCINGGTVENLVLDSVAVDGDQYAVGGVAGFTDSALILDVTVIGSITNIDNGVGGIVGVAYDSTLERVSFEGNISGTNNSGGLAGIMVRSDVTDCYSYGSVEGSINIGGIIGNITSVGYNSSVRRCYGANHVSDIGTSTDPRMGTAVGLIVGSAQFGEEGGESLDAVFALASGDKPLVGSTSESTGTLISATREILLDPESYERAGWDLETVWNPPTRTSVPTLR